MGTRQSREVLGGCTNENMYCIAGMCLVMASSEDGGASACFASFLHASG